MERKIKQLENKVLDLDAKGKDLAAQVRQLQEEIVFERKRQIMNEQMSAIGQWVREGTKNEEL